MQNLRRAALLVSALSIVLPIARADEGMWLLNAPPTKRLQEKYHFTPTPEWMEHLQKSCVRFETGGSGSIISADGLVMTNHHVGSDMLLKLSTKEHNLLAEGFYAKTRDAELKCPDLELNILWDIQDVTDQVNAATQGKPEAEVGKARREAIAAIEKAGKDKTGLKSEVVTLYGGAKYHLYQYRSYTDIRLVFAPEEAIAFFGGDTDNFEFPRYDLDCCFFRIYDHGKPLKPEHHLTWSPSGANENDLIFVCGHPGHTDRLNTYDHLKIARDQELPRRLAEYWRREIKDQTFAGRSAENARIVRDNLFGIANSRKAVTGELDGLQDPAIMAAKKADEDALRAKVNADPAMKSRWSSAWDQIAALKLDEQKFAERRMDIDRVLNGYGGSRLMDHAITLVRLAEELPKPSDQRLKEFGDAHLDSLYLDLYSPEPIYDSLEVFFLSQTIQRCCERFGCNDPTVVTMLGGKSPIERAEDLVKACTLRDPAARRALAKGGEKAILASHDPMIQLARALDPESRALRKRYEDTVEAPLEDAYARVSAARFAIFGDSVYPDATFTLRITFGQIKGWIEAGEMEGAVPAFTSFAGLYQRAAERRGQEGFELPPSWIRAKDRLSPGTPFNFVCTADIIGGNSGSPVVNREGQLVGLIFDGNLPSLVGDFVYDVRANRAVAVDSRALVEAIRVVYGADGLAKEITGSENSK
ncbi:MAG TPA: S46 family peptidase [Phycisphaerales bacterium]|nr:S46 family peptidase [Phycisphaerales bacterium]